MNPDRQKNYIGCNAFSGREENLRSFSALALESFDAAFEIEFDTFLRQVLKDGPRLKKSTGAIT